MESKVQSAPEVKPESIPHLVRVLLIGPHGSGKTALRRAALHQPFTQAYKPGFLSVHDTYMHINNTSVPVELWDATEESWPAVTQLLVDVVVVCIDISNPRSIEYIRQTEYFKTLLKHQWDTPIILAGCKDDLRSTEHPSKLLSQDNAANFSEAMQIAYSECSSLNGDVESILRIVGMIVTSNERREHYRTPAQMYGNKVNLVQGLSDMSVARGLRHICHVYGKRFALGERMVDSDGERLLRYRWTTYEELGNRIKNFGVGLRSLVPPRSFVCLCAENSVSWIVSDMAMQVQNMVSVMVHYTLPDEDIDYIVSHSELDAVITTPNLVKSFARAAAVNPKLKAIILQLPDLSFPGSNENGLSAPAPLATFPKDLLKECLAIAPNTHFLTMSELEAVGALLPDDFVENTTPDEVFSISYTSGSTGRPKGIMMSYKAHKADILHESMSPAIGVVFEPLSHSERLNSYAKLCGGGRIAFFRGEMENLLEELQVCGPTLFISVPRFWNVLYGEFNKIVALYRKHMPEKGPSAAHALARQLFESLMGGRITYAATGGAPTSAAVLAWMHGFSFIVSESYGSMEVGGITSSKKFSSELEYKLVDVPEMGYTSQDKPYPRGELCVKSTTMFSGYHNNPQETNESFTEGGFFRTGDIVQMEGPDSIKIIDRKKFIFKLAQGEYVSPAKSEGVYEKSKFVGQIMVHGNSLQSYLVALVVPNEAILKSWAASHKIRANFEQLCALPQIKSLILTEMKNCELNSQLRPYEKVRDILISPTLMTADNGLLTATSKLNRRAILNKYRNQLEALYERPLGDQSSSSSDHMVVEGDDKALAQLKALVAAALSSGGVTSSEMDISNDTHLAESGLDSMAALKLVKTIEREMKVSVPISSLYQPGTTVESLAQAVSHQQGTLEHLRDADGDMLDEEISPSVDIDPYNWIRDLLPPHKTANEKRLEEKAKSDAQKALKLDAQKELMAKLLKPVGSEASSSASTATSSSESTTPRFKSPKRKSQNSLNTAIGAHLFEYKSYHHILLTGATGFLGIYLLKEILDAFPEATVRCIIRGASEAAALKKLEAAISFAKLDVADPELKSGSKKFKRIQVINADLANERRFGLSEEKWKELEDSVDSIYHCATWVNTLFPYQVLRPANVVSTVQLVRLALTGKKPRKAFHYISTTSALSRASGWTPEFSISTSAKLFGFDGYPLTKRVCEMFLSSVEELIPDFPLVIYRPGAIVGHSQTGHINIEAFIHKLICGIVQFGAFPTSKKWKMQMDWTPVDYCAQSIVHISKTGGSMRTPKRYNINNPYSIYSLNMTRLASYMISFGYPLVSKPFRIWRRELHAHFDERPGFNALEPLRNNFDDGFPSDSRIECSSTVHSLKPLKRLVEHSRNTVIDHESPPLTRCHPISEATDRKSVV